MLLHAYINLFARGIPLLPDSIPNCNVTWNLETLDKNLNSHSYTVISTYYCCTWE